MRLAATQLLSALMLTLLLACGSDKGDHSGSGGQGATGGGGPGGTSQTGGGGQAAGAGGQSGGGSFATGGLGGSGGVGGTAGLGAAGHSQGGKGGQGGVGGTGGAGGGGSSCATAVAGQPCNGEGLTCGDCPSACQNCVTFRCSQGHWQTQEAFAAPCFSCGPTLRCQKTATYCHIVEGGPVGSTPSYSCPPSPSSCLPTPTCACLKGTAVGICDDKTPGEITVTLEAP